MNIQELKVQIISAVKAMYDASECKAIASVYIEDKLHIEKSAQINDLLLELPEEHAAEVLLDIKKLANGMPVQYVTGIQWFSGNPYQVNSEVLIPRPETEELVEWIFELHKTLQARLRILDIGTGSGCIPISLKLKMPSSEVFATEISAKAISIAKLNAEKLNADVTFIEDDILNTAFNPAGKFDILISNPPYIPFSESAVLEKNVVDYEPHIALFAPDEDPLVFYKAILSFAIIHLKPLGHLFFEIHKDFGAFLLKLPEMSAFKEITLKNDMNGNPRFLRAVLREINNH